MIDNGDFDAEHPTDEWDGPRYLMETHRITVRHDVSDEWFQLKISAVFIDSCGPAVEIGPWSVSPDEARVLAASLTMLADHADNSVVYR
jgi:hypothetical protein